MGACQRGRVRQLATKSSLNWKFRLTKAAPSGEGGGRGGRGEEGSMERRSSQGVSRGRKGREEVEAKARQLQHAGSLCTVQIANAC